MVHGDGVPNERRSSTVTARFEYDAANRRAGRWDAASGCTEYVHDPAGRVLGELRYVAMAPGSGHRPGTAGCVEFRDYEQEQRALHEFEQEMLNYFWRTSDDYIDLVVQYAN